jgi:hypothetical protein
MSNIDYQILELLGCNNDLLRLPVLYIGMSCCFLVMGILESSLDTTEQVDILVNM